MSKKITWPDIRNQTLSGICNLALEHGYHIALDELRDWLLSIKRSISDEEIGLYLKFFQKIKEMRKKG